MPVSITASGRSYRVSKPQKPLRSILSGKKSSRNTSSRISSSSSSSYPSPRKSSSTSNKRAAGNSISAPSNRLTEQRLPDHGPTPLLDIVPSPLYNLHASNAIRGLVSLILRYQFSSVPLRRSGLSSIRVAEVLNFKRALPPLVTKEHVLALSSSATDAEREIAKLVRIGILRKIVVPGWGPRGGGSGEGRGGGSAGMVDGEGLVEVDEWTRRVREHKGLEEDVKEKYIKALRAHPTEQSITLSSTELTVSDATALVHAGFLTTSSSTTANISPPNPFDSHISSTIASSSLSSSSPTRPTLLSTSQRASSGTLEAVGGKGAVHDFGGGGGGGSVTNTNNRRNLNTAYTFALPNTGTFLHLLRTSKQHLRTLLLKSSKFKEIPLSTLKERWDGGSSSSNHSDIADVYDIYKKDLQRDTAHAPHESSHNDTFEPEARGLGDDNVVAVSINKTNAVVVAQTGPAKNGDFADLVDLNGTTAGRTRKWRQFRGLSFEWVLAECVGGGWMECFETGSVGAGVRLR